jgi:hypothetical protein
MLPIDGAIVFPNGQDVSGVSEAARKPNVNRSTLYHKFQRQSGSRHQAAQRKRFLSIRQEKTIVKHIIKLYERGSLPAPCTIASIAGQVARKQPGKNWTSRFVRRWSAELDSRYLNTLGVSRHKTKSVSAFKQYFGASSWKIEEYGIQPKNMYNMDEKAF